MSFFLLGNSLGAKMKKGIRNFCNNDDSTSTLNQQHVSHIEVLKNSSTASISPPKTLEEMILQLELEEEIARKTTSFDGDDDDEPPEMIMHHRMSCVNNSDILRSARNALNQYPRFSLDGKDAMYRSSFRNSSPASNFACSRRDGEAILCRRGTRAATRGGADKVKCLPTMLAGERVIWCKPGVVAKLMGLEAMPVPLFAKTSRDDRGKERLSSVMRRQSLRKMTERREMERRRLLVMEDINSGCGGGIRRGNNNAHAKPTGYCAMKAIPVVEPILLDRKGGWPKRRSPR